MTLIANAARAVGALLIASAALAMSWNAAVAQNPLKAKVGVLRLSSSARGLWLGNTLRPG